MEIVFTSFWLVGDRLFRGFGVTSILVLTTALRFIEVPLLPIN